MELHQPAQVDPEQLPGRCHFVIAWEAAGAREAGWYVVAIATGATTNGEALDLAATERPELADQPVLVRAVDRTDVKIPRRVQPPPPPVEIAFDPLPDPEPEPEPAPEPVPAPQEATP